MGLPNNPNHPYYRKHPASSQGNKGSRVKTRPKTILPKELASLSLDVLDLSVRSRNALRRSVKTVGELALLSDSGLLDFQNVGQKSLIDVHRALDEFIATHGEVIATSTDVNGTHDQSSGRWRSGLSPGGWPIPLGIIHSGGDTPKDIDNALTAPVEVLDLSNRSSHALSKLKIHTVLELLLFPQRALLQAKNIGRKSLNELQSKLLSYLTHIQSPDEHNEPCKPLPTASLGTKAFADQILSLLPERQKSVIADRYGLWDGIAETLEDIGDKLGLTRERIRQIEQAGLKRLRRVYSYTVVTKFILDKTKTFLASQSDSLQGILAEDEITDAFADDCSTEESMLALNLLKDINASLFQKQLIEVEPGVYCLDESVARSYRSLLKDAQHVLHQHQKPIADQEFQTQLLGQRSDDEGERSLLKRILQVSPSVVHIHNGTLSLSEWTEFRKRDATSVAEATLRILGRPAHFRDIAQKAMDLFPDAGPLNERTVHNAMIHAAKTFTWVKSGTYGLSSWGLRKPPYIKDRLIELLSVSPYPLPYWHLREKVLEVCNCKEASVRMTLDFHPRTFKKFEGDHYSLQKHYEAQDK